MMIVFPIISASFELYTYFNILSNKKQGLMF